MTEASERRSTWPEATVVVVLLLAGLVYFVGDLGANGSDPSEDTVSLTAAEVRQLKPSTTHTTVKRAPKDGDQQGPTGGRVVHPTKLTPVFDAPGGEPIAKVHKKEFGDVWLPVISEESGWLKVMLPSRPNRSTGWIQDDGLRTATTPYLIRVHTGSRTVELLRDGESVGAWPAAVGKPGTPTPVGRTFVLGQFTDSSRPDLSTVIPLGTHSETHTTYGGGPGTVAFHGWTTDTSVFGQAISEGCVRLPEEALEVLRTVPLGTTVLIDDH